MTSSSCLLQPRERVEGRQKCFSLHPFYPPHSIPHTASAPIKYLLAAWKKKGGGREERRSLHPVHQDRRGACQEVRPHEQRGRGVESWCKGPGQGGEAGRLQEQQNPDQGVFHTKQKSSVFIL